MSLSRREFTRLLAGAAVAPAWALDGAFRGAVAGKPTASASSISAAPAWPGYERAIVIDCLASPGAFNVPGAAPGLGPDAIEAARASGITAVNVTLGVVGNVENAFEDTVKDLARWERETDRHGDVFRRIRTADDVVRAKEAGQVGLVYGFQDTSMLDGDLEKLDTFHALGVRIIQLTYNRRNLVGDGSLEPDNAGLSTFGHAVVERMNELGVLVDLSHCGQRTTAEGIHASSAPPAITHSGCAAVYDHPRNKRDEELRALADKGGVVGIYLMPYLNAAGPPTAGDVMRHLAHALDVCGEDHVGIGSDQSITPVPDGPEYRKRLAEAIRKRRQMGISAPREDTAPFVPDLNTPRRLERIADLMAEGGYPDRVIEKIVGANWLRLFREVWT